MLASAITNGAATTLVDTAHVTWPVDELIGYLNEALRATSLVKPDLVTEEAEILLQAGVEQSLPTNGIALIAITRNTFDRMRVVTEVDQQMLAEAQRFWPSGTPQVEVEHFTVNPATPRRFNVYPPNSGTGGVLATYGVVPPEITSVDDLLPVLDIYQQPLTDYVLARAYEKNTQRQDLVKAAAKRQDWARAIGARSQAQMAISPKVASQPGVA